jgi:hypothetical protein
MCIVNTIVLTIVTTLSIRGGMDELIEEIEAWLKVSGMVESRLGLLACANPKALERVRDGSAQVKTLRQLVDYVRKNKQIDGRH